MYDDIAYRKDDIQERSVYVLEYTICITTLRRAKTIFQNVVHMYWKTTELKDDIRILWLPVGGQIME